MIIANMASIFDSEGDEILSNTILRIFSVGGVPIFLYKNRFFSKKKFTLLCPKNDFLQPPLEQRRKIFHLVENMSDTASITMDTSS